MEWQIERSVHISLCKVDARFTIYSTSIGSYKGINAKQRLCPMNPLQMKLHQISATTTGCPEYTSESIHHYYKPMTLVNVFIAHCYIYAIKNIVFHSFTFIIYHAESMQYVVCQYLCRVLCFVNPQISTLRQICYSRWYMILFAPVT